MLLVVAACAALASGGAGPPAPAVGGARPEVWVFPAPWPGNGRGLRQMVERESEWAEARSLADGLGYWPWLLDAWYSDRELRSFFVAMRRWRLRLGLELPVVKAPAWGAAMPLDARRAFAYWSAQAERLRRCGMRRVDSFVFDQPVYAARHVIPAHEPAGALPDAPGRPTQATPAAERIAYGARETAAFVAMLRRDYPRARVGLIEPYPALSLGEIQQAVETIQHECRRLGVRGLDFLRIDPDWGLMGPGGQGSWEELTRLEEWCRRRGLGFSMIVWAAQNPRMPRGAAQGQRDLAGGHPEPGRGDAARGAAPRPDRHPELAPRTGGRRAGSAPGNLRALRGRVWPDIRAAGGAVGQTARERMDRLVSGKRIVIVGGVAGGATAAARLRRLNEASTITVFERGPHVSFANCGLPYFVGGEIPREEDLLLQTPDSLRGRYRIDVRVRHEVLSIDRAAREVEVCDLEAGATFRQPYDALVLSPGAAPIRPPIPGIEREGIFTVRSVPDVAAMVRWIEAKSARTAVVVGGGYIGLEMAEQLRRRGLEVTVAEALGQLMAALDHEMAAPLVGEMRAHGVGVRLNDGMAALDAPDTGERARCCTVILRSGARLPADLVVLAIGVRPETMLATSAGLEMGPSGGIRVDHGMRTSDPAIWAVGDAVEVRHFVTGEPCLIALAGPANRQARIAADCIEGRDTRYEGTLGTGILRVFGLAVAATGATERRLKAAGIDCRAVHLHPPSHAGYYPGGAPIAMKVLFDPASGKLLGAQAVGRDGVDKRIDVLATAIRAGLTVDELGDLELAYSPPFGSAKDAVNLAGWAAGNVLRGDVQVATWDEARSLDQGSTLLLDVRTPEERAEGHIPGSIFIPLHELRDRLGELPRDRDIVVYCRSGQRSYYACRILTQRGFSARNLSGAYLTWSAAAGANGGAAGAS